MTVNKRLGASITGGGLFILFLGLVMILSTPLAPGVHAQQPTGSIPTVTGTVEGAIAIVYADRDIIGVFAGPSPALQIGILLAGEEVPALGYSVDREWIQIVYLGVPGGKGWVYAPFVSILRGSTLPVVPNPPTATPRTTPTIDPTQAAQFGYQLTPIRLATFTEPSPLEILEFETESGTRPGLPAGMIILVLGLVGLLGAAFSVLRGR